MSLALLKLQLKKNYKLLLIFLGILTMYMSVMISMYDPDDMEALASMLNLMPRDLLSAMGFSDMVTDLTGYLASWLYGMLMIAFPMVYSIILGNKLVAKKVDDCSFAYLLSTPLSRDKIIITKGIYALLSIVALFVFLTIMGVIMANLMYPQALNVAKFLLLNFTTLLVNMVVMMICFFFSCLFNDTKRSLTFGAGIPIMFILMKMLGDASTKIEFLKKISIYGLYDPVELVNGGNIWGVNFFYVFLIATLFTLSVIVFKNKRLPL